MILLSCMSYVCVVRVILWERWTHSIFDNKKVLYQPDPFWLVKSTQTPNNNTSESQGNIVCDGKKPDLCTGDTSTCFSRELEPTKRIEDEVKLKIRVAVKANTANHFGVLKHCKTFGENVPMLMRCGDSCSGGTVEFVPSSLGCSSMSC